MAASRIPAPVEEKPDMEHRANEVIQALSRIKPGSGGVAARPAPKWVHKLVDFLWDALS